MLIVPDSFLRTKSKNLEEVTPSTEILDYKLPFYHETIDRIQKSKPVYGTLYMCTYA